MHRSISADEFYQKSKVENIRIIDVRETDEFLRGHIPTAKTLPLSELKQHINQLDKNEEYYINCQSGVRSVNACDFLDSEGYQVINVLGGMSSWKGKQE